MLLIDKLPENEVQGAINNSEFSAELLGVKKDVAVVLTQSWCSQWHMMSRYLDDFAKQGAPEGLEIQVYTLEYDKISDFDAFRTMKESSWKNDLVPYVRYYRNKELIHESNFLSAEMFLDIFRQG